MCVQKETYEALRKAGVLDDMSPAEQAMNEARIKDATNLEKKINDCTEKSEKADAELKMELNTVKKDVIEIKTTMVTKDFLTNELNEFRTNLAGEIQKAAKFDLVGDIVKSKWFWVVAFAFLGLFMGVKYLDFLIGVANVAS